MELHLLTIHSVRTPGRSRTPKETAAKSDLSEILDIPTTEQINKKW